MSHSTAIAVEHITLFGSQARGDAELGSGIDVPVVLKSPVNPGEEIKRTGKAIADLSLHYKARDSHFSNILPPLLPLEENSPNPSDSQLNFTDF